MKAGAESIKGARAPGKAAVLIPDKMQHPQTPRAADTWDDPCPALPCPALPSSLEEPGLRLQPTPGTMRPAVSIALALVALLVLADSARSEPGEPTLMQKLEQFKENVKVFADNIGEKTKAALQELHDSEFSTKTRNWFSEHFKKVKEKLKDTFA